MRRNVLVVDDDAHIRELLKLMLEQAGFEYRCCKDGYSVMSELRERPYDLVILDIHLPHMNGIKVLEQIRADENLKDTPVLMLTMDSDKAQVLKASHLEVTDYVLKPPTREDLLQRVERVLGGKPQFQEIHFEPDDPRVVGDFSLNTRLDSISRRGIVIHCENEMAQGSYMDGVELPILKDIGIMTKKFMVSKTEKAEDGGFLHYVSFSQLSDEERSSLSDWIMQESYSKKAG